jgi:hypothetical protein
VIDNPEFYDELVQKVVSKINNVELPIEEEEEENDVEEIFTPEITLNKEEPTVTIKDLENEY